MLILKIDWGQLSDYPFNAHVWGTASDVAMVIVTGITAWFLIKTFKEQQKITSIEEFRHSESIKPRFVLTYFKEKEQIENKIISAKFSLALTLEENTAKDLEITVYKPFQLTETMVYEEKREILHQNSMVWLSTPSIEGLLYYNKEGVVRFSYHVLVKIKFQDTIGAQYLQTFQIKDTDDLKKTIDVGPIIRMNPLFRKNHAGNKYKRFVSKKL